MGGSTFPTVATISELGLLSPSDMAAAIPKGATGGYRGIFVTERIPLPANMTWDILHLDGNFPKGTEVTVSVLDPTLEPIPGYEGLDETNVDLSDIENWRSVHVEVTITSPDNLTVPSLDWVLVNWMDEMTWREQFYGKAKFGGNLGLDIVDFQLDTAPSSGSGPQLVFPSPRGEEGYTTPSLAFMDAGGVDYNSIDPLRLNTMGAFAADAADVNGDGSKDLAFAVYRTTGTSYDAKSPIYLNSPTGWYGVPDHTFLTTGARDVLLADLNDDSYVDVVFAQENNWSSFDIESILFWGSASGWADTPDLKFATNGASDVDAVDVDIDGRLDLIFVNSMDLTPQTDSMVFLQDATGFCGTVPSYRLPTLGARAVSSGDLDGDGHVDLVFANSFSGSSYEVESSIYWGKTGGGFASTPTNLSTMGARDVQVADLDRDGHLDLVFANSQNDSEVYLLDSYVFLNDRSGGFGPDPDVSLPTMGAYGVAVADLDGVGYRDLVFANKFDGETFDVPSYIYLGGASGWATEPDAELPTEGASDVLAVSFVVPDKGGYVSQIITPKDPTMVAYFHTFSYTATLGAAQSAKVVFIDSETEDVLAEFDLSDGTNEIDMRSAITIRDHPSIRVMIVAEGLTGPGGMRLDDLYLNWTERSLVPPLVHGLGIDATTVYRTQSVELWVNTTDEYYPFDELSVKIEHRLDGSTSWGTFLLEPMTAQDELWTVEVLPARHAPLGVYHFRLSVKDPDGNTTGFIDFPETLEVLPNLPTEPITVNATGDDAKVRLDWRPPIDKGDNPILGYRIHRGLADDSLSLHTSVDSMANSYIDTGLTNGVTYYYAILAYSDLGDGVLSPVVFATPLGLPGQPRNLTAEAADAQVTISWEAPVVDGGTPILGYYVYRGLRAGNYSFHADTEDLTFTDTDLVNGQTYYYWISPFNEVGEGMMTSYVYVTPFGLPDAPETVTCEIGVGHLVIDWEAPSDNGGSAITAYVVYRGSGPGSLSELFEVGSMTLSYTDTDVVVGTEYFYAVAVVTAAGEGAKSGVCSGVPTGPPGVPNDLTATPGDGEVILDWAAPDFDGTLPITGYVILRGTAQADLVELDRTGVVFTFTDATVSNDRTYYYAVAAINDAGTGDFTAAVDVIPFEPATVPGSPRSVAGTVKGAKVLLTWTPPDSDGGSDITGYVVLRGLTPDEMEVIAELGVVLMYTDEGLPRGKNYLYTVVAVNEVGQGEPFNAITLKVPKKKDESPGYGLPLSVIAILSISNLIRSASRRW
jgi:hypothetical protein